MARDLPASDSRKVDTGHDECLVLLGPTAVARFVAQEGRGGRVDSPAGNGQFRLRSSVRRIALSPKEKLLPERRIIRCVVWQSTPRSACWERGPQPIGPKPKGTLGWLRRIGRWRHKRPV